MGLPLKSVPFLHRPELIQGSDLEIVTTYNSELRGLANYYSLADDVKEKLKWANYLSLYSLFKTLSAKHKSSMSATIRTLKVGNEYFHRYKEISHKNRRNLVNSLQPMLKAT